MIELVTGVPGSGKSLFCVKKLVEAKKEGRPIFTDIEGLSVEGVMPAPDDWRDTPEGSLIIYDEAQRRFPSTGRPGVPDDERLRALETHRHSGHDLVFITQRPAMVHHHIRGLVGRHTHCHRVAGLKACTLFTWDMAVADPYDYHTKQQADVQRWTYPKALFGLYKSATVHTHKIRIPKKLGVVLLLLALGASYVGYRFYHQSPTTNPALVKGEGERAGERGGARPPPPAAPLPTSDRYSWSSTAKAVPVMGCIASTTRCMCFADTGEPLALSDAQCLSAITAPLPRALRAQTADSQSLEAPGQAAASMVPAVAQEAAEKVESAVLSVGPQV